MYIMTKSCRAACFVACKSTAIYAFTYENFAIVAEACGAGQVGVYACAAVAGVQALANCYCGLYANAGCDYGIYSYAARDVGILGCAYRYYGVIGNAHCSNPVVGNGAYYDSSSSSQVKITTCRNLDVLARIRGLEIHQWKYHDRNQRGPDEFIGPYEDGWRDAFGLHFSQGIYEASVGGAALRGVQELDLCREVQACCICGLVDCLCGMEARLANIENLLRRCA